MTNRKIILASRGSALALAQSTAVQAFCRAAFPELEFELRIIKTTGDKMQTQSLATTVQESTKGLFTKELEVALLEGAADFAVHSLKDLPTELPPGLELAAVSERADPRDVLIFRKPPNSGKGPRGFSFQTRVQDFPADAVIATSSTRRQAQLLELNSGLKSAPIRGNVGTRLKKIAENSDLDAIVLAAAGLSRLQLRIGPSGQLSASAAVEAPPENLLVRCLSIEEMIPCVGQAALGIEARANDSRIAAICQKLNHPPTQACVTAERAFLRAMGGGCLSPVAAFAEIIGRQLRIRGISFHDQTMRRAELTGPVEEAERLGESLARQVK